jgi:NAD(P)-dependent dehydrogenase (short-subunit alcohol dehydrogenase family)
MTVEIDLTGKTALVTGGTRNIGRAIAILLSQAGATVSVIGSTSQERLDETLGAIDEQDGHAGVGLLADCGDADELRGALGEIVDKAGPIDILVNNVGIRPRTELEDVTIEEWDRVIAVNLRAAFICSQFTIPGMRERGWGRIINISGLDALAGSGGRGHVTSSKGGLYGLTASLAPDCARFGVTVNTLTPGTIDTFRHSPDWYPETERLFDKLKRKVPMHRLGHEGEIASVALFLASDLSSYMTGQNFTVAGGFPMWPSIKQELADE